MTQDKKHRQLGTLHIIVNGKNKLIRTSEFNQYEEGFSFCVESELDAFQAAYLYQRQSVRVICSPSVSKWLVQVNKPKLDFTFDPGQSFESTHEALTLIVAQKDSMAALFAVIQRNIEYGEFGFASELVRGFELR